MGNDMNFLKISALVGASMLAAPTAMAASILIDDFTDVQEVRSTPDGGFNEVDTLGGLSVRGGFRTLSVSTDPQNGGGTAPPAGSVLKSTGFQGIPGQADNVLRFSNQDQQRGIASVTYGIAAGGAALGDLTLGGVLDKFFFEVLSADLTGTMFSTQVTDGGGGTDTFNEFLDATFNPFTNFSEFSGVDFGDVASLTFTFNTLQIESFDGSLGSISVVPLPASILFLLGGLGGLAGVSTVSKRRRKA